MDQLIITIVVVIIIILIVCRCMGFKRYEGAQGGRYRRGTGMKWVKYPGWYSRGGNIVQYPHFRKNPNWLARKCLNTPGCKGFSTDGWLKNRIMPRNRWTRVSNKKALYLRA